MRQRALVACTNPCDAPELQLWLCERVYPSKDKKQNRTRKGLGCEKPFVRGYGAGSRYNRSGGKWGAWSGWAHAGLSSAGSFCMLSAMQQRCWGLPSKRRMHMHWSDRPAVGREKERKRKKKKNHLAAKCRKCSTKESIVRHGKPEKGRQPRQPKKPQPLASPQLHDAAKVASLRLANIAMACRLHYPFPLPCTSSSPRTLSLPRPSPCFLVMLNHLRGVPSKPS